MPARKPYKRVAVDLVNTMDPFDLLRFVRAQNAPPTGPESSAITVYDTALREMLNGEKVPRMIPDGDEDPEDLAARFASGEILDGRVSPDWQDFVLPRLRGNNPGQPYGLRSMDEAHAYFDIPVLKNRLLELMSVIQLQHDKNAIYPVALMGGSRADASKLHSCVELFSRVSPETPVFQTLLTGFFADFQPDEGEIPAEEEPEDVDGPKTLHSVRNVRLLLDAPTHRGFQMMEYQMNWTSEQDDNWYLASHFCHLPQYLDAYHRANPTQPRPLMLERWLDAFNSGRVYVPRDLDNYAARYTWLPVSADAQHR